MIAAQPRRPTLVVGGLTAALVLGAAVPFALAFGAGTRGGYQAMGASFRWEPLLVGLHLITDLLIGLAYVGISGTLIVLARRARHSIPFLWVFVAFGLFIISCGLTHFMAALTLWAPLYWVAGGIKYATALASVGTALAIPPLIPKVMLLVESTKVADERRAQLEAVLASLDEGVVLQYADGRIGACNESASRILGVATGQVLDGASLDPAREAVREDGSPWPAAEQPAMVALRTGRPSKGAILGVRTRAGEVTWLIVNARPLFRAGGAQPYATVSSFVDTTEAREAEGALRASEERYRQVEEHAPSGLSLVAPDGRWLRVNRALCALVGYSEEELLTSNFQEISHPDDLDAEMAYVRQVLAGEIATYQMEKRYIRKDGARVWILLSVSLVRDDAGKPLYFISQIQDIDERKRVEEALHASERAYRELNEGLEARIDARTSELQAAVRELEAFSYSVSHDLRAPLRALHGFSRILSAEHAAELAPEARRYLGLIEGEAQRMGVLIDDLLRLSRLGRQALDLRQVRPEDLATQAMHDLRGEVEGRRVEFTLGELPPCTADAALLRQVFANLLGNALKFTRGREVARIEVGCRREDGEQVYYVRDNGAGFDMRYVGKLFEAFQRLHGADQFEGTGVGLAIVQRIVHRHGGRIWAEGEKDAGATFSFTVGEGKHGT